MQEYIIAIKSFVECFESPDTVPKLMWELLSAAITSDYADDWDKNKRADMLLLYDQICALSNAAHGISPLLLLAEKNPKID